MSTKLAVLIEDDRVTMHNLLTGTTSNNVAGEPNVPTPPAITSAIDAMFRLAKGEKAPEPTHGWWDNPQESGGSRYNLGVVSPGGNGDVPSRAWTTGEQLIQINTGDFFIPFDIPAEAVPGTRVSVKLMGVPDGAGDVIAKVTAERGELTGAGRSAAQSYSFVVGEAQLDMSHKPGSRFWVNVRKDQAGGAIALQQTIEA